MHTPEHFSPEAKRKAVLTELSKGGALPSNEFSTVAEALASLKKPGDKVSGTMRDGVGEWMVTRGATEADLTIKAGGDYETK